MNLGLPIGIIGIIATIIFGYFSIRNQKYLGKISLIKKSCINLYDSVVSRINQLEISYNNKTINKNMFLVQSYLINNGQKDITNEMVDKKITLSLPSDSIILDYSIIEQSPNLKCSIKPLSNNVLEFEFGLFRINEFVQFEYLVESNMSDKIDNYLNFDHRIADTVKIKEIQLNSENEKKKYFISKLLPVLSFSILLFISLIIFSTINYRINKQKLNQEIVGYSEYNGLLNDLLLTDKKKQPDLYIALKSEYDKKVKIHDNYNFMKYLFNKEGVNSLILFLLFLFFSVFFIYSYKKYRISSNILTLITNHE